MKIVTVLGARPQFVKAAVVSRGFKEYEEIDECIVHTGQHFDEAMSDIFFEQMSIPKPDFNLGISGLTHGAMTGQMLESVEGILLEQKPDVLMVYGDTNSTLAGALAASKLSIPVVHVEAGLRSFNMAMPEEINRILTDRVSKFLLCPTEAAIKNLACEGYVQGDAVIANVGDVMQDAAMFYRDRAKMPEELQFKGQSFVLATLHRAENTDDPARLQELVEALNDLHQRVEVVLPLHPRTKAALERSGLQLKVTIIDPVGYLEMMWLLEHCCLVLTDSGGLQKEAFFFAKPCVTLRAETEWVELLEHGVNRLADTKELILESVFEMLQESMDFSVNLYGGGKACDNIIKAIVDGL